MLKSDAPSDQPWETQMIERGNRSVGNAADCAVAIFMWKQGIFTRTSPSPLCKPDMVYILDRAHGLHFFCVSVMPAFYRDYGFQSFIENPE